MRILVLGAGAVGGYFGGRLLAAGRDVTFLVRRNRAAVLARNGLEIRSSHGDLRLPAPPTVTADSLRESFDLILLSCKAPDLENAIESLAPAVGRETALLPLLNGVRHLKTLGSRFGVEKVLGGGCFLSTVLDDEGRVLHLNETHRLSFGELEGGRTERAQAIDSALANSGFEAHRSDTILQEMWEKWVFIATAAGMTCLMRAAIGDLVTAGATGAMLQLLDECSAIATREGFPPGEASLARNRMLFTKPGSLLTASMFRDIEERAPVESEQIVGDLLRRGQKYGLRTPLLEIAYLHLKCYEARRARERAAR